MKTLLLALSLSFFTNFIFSQTEFARIEKNSNIQANILFHDLNKSKDTLLLKSESEILHIYSINSDYKREIDVYLGETDLQIPLSKLTKGKHVMVVDLNPKKIIFVIYINDNLPVASIEN
ncbi:hypothetical protein [Formosa maritima]|uniref:DUF3244 domain-containing protein n=1 Tax=Formosa maritima TaxID=2592046 RepID=A0A5D0GES5_9FLAO|nr:hypothetical protein [Formosa maritima]TYA56819.1 hypothetical protein FVF61_05530 [Formosa maritima]